MKMRNKKLFILIMLSLLLPVLSFAETGFGFSAGLLHGSSLNNRVSATLKIENVPLVFSVNSDFNDYGMNGLGLGIDWWIPYSASTDNSELFHFYYGPGLEGELKYLEQVEYYVAGRALIGFNLKVSSFEFYMQSAFEAGWESDTGFVWYAPIDAGFRLWAD